MKDRDALRRALERIDGRPYGFYRDLRDQRYDLGPAELQIAHVQGDPFAAPSRLQVEVSPARAKLPDFGLRTPDARRACADWLQRALLGALSMERSRTGSGKSGLLEVSAPGPEVLERTGVVVGADGALRVRLQAGLPASGRKILGPRAAELLLERLPALIERLLRGLSPDALRAHVYCVEDQDALRAQLADAGLVAFLAEGSVLPRRSGADAAPLRDGLPLAVPDDLAVELEAPHAGRLRGLGVRQGVTLIVGGGYHGKSTLLQTLAQGVYDHVPGDGRERCVTRADAVVVRAEDGRSVCGADLRRFIRDLPLGRSTARFHSDDASGSTSQAAAIVEALEAGAGALLIDEDTAATNFMIRDARMRRLIPAEQEPITPYLDRVRGIWEDDGVSSVLVLGGAGDYLDVADHVIQMDTYRPRDLRERAREVAHELPLGDAAPGTPDAAPRPAPRVPDPASFNPRRGKRAERVRSVRTRTIEFGSDEIDIALLAQVVDPAQSRAIGDALLAFSRGLCDGRRSIPELLDALDEEVRERGFEAVCEPGFGDRARPRRFEIAAALCRLRGLRLVPAPKPPAL